MRTQRHLYRRLSMRVASTASARWAAWRLCNDAILRVVGRSSGRTVGFGAEHHGGTADVDVRPGLSREARSDFHGERFSSGGRVTRRHEGGCVKPRCVVCNEACQASGENDGV